MITMTNPIHSRERGAALVTTLMLLVIVTLASLATMRSSRLESRMAGNTEARLQAFQAAQALSDAVFATPALVPVIGSTGYRICTPTLPGCDRNSIDLPGVFKGHVDVGELTGVALQQGEGMVPRGLETSADRFSGVRYQITSTFDRTDAKLGRAGVVQGMLVLVPK